MNNTELRNGMVLKNGEYRIVRMHCNRDESTSQVSVPYDRIFDYLCNHFVKEEEYNI